MSLCVLSHSVLSNSAAPWTVTSQLLCPQNFTEAGCHFLLQGIIPIQGLNLCLLHLLHWQADSLPLALPGKLNGFVCVLVAQLCPTLCRPMDCSLVGSSGHGIRQAIILEWVAIPFFRGMGLGYVLRVEQTGSSLVPSGQDSGRSLPQPGSVPDQRY